MEKERTLLISLHEASITLITRKKNYSPFSLVNTDIKIVAKVSAN